jgi:hypothetical protein
MKTTAALAQVLTVITLLLLGPGKCALGATGAKIGLSFTGVNQLQSGVFVPDAMGAVGPDHIVEIENGAYTVYDKATGRLSQRMSLESFWDAAGRRGPEGIPVSNFTSDPRVVYDPTSDRWFAVSIWGESDLLLGASITGDPTFPLADLSRGWRGFLLDGDPTASPNLRWGDFPTLGVNAASISITTNLLSINKTFQPLGYAIYSMPKADLLQPAPTIANRSEFTFDQPPETGVHHVSVLQGVSNFGPGNGSSSLFIASPTLGLQRRELLNTGELQPGAATLSLAIDIPISPIEVPPTGNQPGNVHDLYNWGPSASPFDGFEVADLMRFSSNLVQQGNHVWGVHVAKAGDGSGVRWYEIDLENNQIVQSGTISDPSLDLINPSIAVNPFGDAVIGFTATGEELFPSAYAVVGTTDNGTTTFGQLLELKRGASTFFVSVDELGRNRWGDYSTTVVDPSDPYSFWTFQEFTQAKDRWAVQVTQILLPGAAPRRDEIAIGPALAFQIRDNFGADGLGDTAAGDLTGNLQSSVTVGEADLTNVTANRLERLVAKFELPDRPNASNLLQEATLRVFLENIEGIPAGPLSVLHSVSDNALVRVKSAYEDASYGDSQDLFQLADAVTGQYYDLDVTDLVRADYAQDGAHALSAFRLQIHAANFFEDNLSNRYTVTASGTGRPELLLSFVPEPATSLLAVGSLLGVLTCGGWGRRRCA